MGASATVPPRDRERDDRAAFTSAVKSFRRELRVHCYRMSGSFEESEDLLQETMLRAWRGWPRFQGRASVRTWLYRIATNVCLDYLSVRERRVLPYDVTLPADGSLAGPPPPADRPWLQPAPDSFLAPLMTHDDPYEQVIRRETIELAFLAAIQVLPVRQRAALILRDALGMTAGESAGVLGVSVAAVKSALQRARSAMRRALGGDRRNWSPRPSTEQERAVVRRYLAALADRDRQAMAELLHEDLRVAFPPREFWVEGRQTFIDGSQRFAPAGNFRYLETGANGQPAVAVYLRPPGATAFRLLSLAVLRVAGARIIEIVDFGDPAVLTACGLPNEL